MQGLQKKCVGKLIIENENRRLVVFGKEGKDIEDNMNKGECHKCCSLPRHWKGEGPTISTTNLQKGMTYFNKFEEARLAFHDAISAASAGYCREA